MQIKFRFQTAYQSILQLNNNQGMKEELIPDLKKSTQKSKENIFMKRKNPKNYVVRVLDLKYQSEFKQLSFNYIYYKVAAQHEEQAITKAHDLYMKGGKGELIQELPILLKIYSVETTLT